MIISLYFFEIQTLKSSNQTLTDIYTTLKTLNLTGVIEENVQTVKHSIEEFEVRSEMLKDVNFLCCYNKYYYSGQKYPICS